MKESYFFQTYRNIKNKLPDYVLNSMKSLIPAFFASSMFEIFGLLILFPVINVIIDAGTIQKTSYLQFIYDRFQFHNTVSFVLFLLSSITIIFILKNIFLFMIYRMQSNISYDLVRKITLEKYQSYLNKSYSFHAENNTSVLLRNFVQIPSDLISYSVLPFFNIVNELFIILLIISGIVAYDTLLFISLVLFAFVFLLIYNRTYKKKLKSISELKNTSHEGMYKTGMQSMEGFREILVFDKQKYFKGAFQKHLNTFSKASGDSYLLNIFSPKIVETTAVIAIFLIFIFGYLFNKNLNSLAQFLIFFSIAAYRIIPSINKMILSFNYMKASAYVYEYFDKSDFQSPTNKTEPKNSVGVLNFNKTISIRNLSFKFSNKKEPILKNISLSIGKSKTIGITGPSGSGKTTLLNILLRLYEEQEGGIFVDNVKIDRAKLSEWYKITSYVPQNTILLDGTVAENIAFGVEKNEINYELLNDVIEKSLLKKFIDGLAEGVATQIGEKGIKISGGQRQRIGIARALYHQGEILIFDEATSSLDYETEKMLTESIDNISTKTDMTVIIVAHRLQTLQYCNEIYKLENGVISEVTTYANLMQQNTTP